jgi:hypothetical protein
MTNTDKMVEFVLKNTNDLPPSKIHALADVIRALGGEVEKAPNRLPVKNDPLMEEEAPIDLSEVQGLVIDGQAKPIKIYSE